MRSPAVTPPRRRQSQKGAGFAQERTQSVHDKVETELLGLVSILDVCRAPSIEMCKCASEAVSGSWGHWRASSGGPCSICFLGTPPPGPLQRGSRWPSRTQEFLSQLLSPGWHLGGSVKLKELAPLPTSPHLPPQPCDGLCHSAYSGHGGGLHVTVMFLSR